MELVATIDVRKNLELPNENKTLKYTDWLVQNLHEEKLLVPFSILEYEQEMHISVVQDELFDKLQIVLIIPLMVSTLSDEDFDDYFPRETVERKLLHIDFEIRVHDLFIALQIAYPGQFDFLNISFFMDGKRIHRVYHDRLISPFTVSYAKELEAFKLLIKVIDFRIVWKWLKSIQDFWNEVPNSKIGIFLNYYRYFYYDFSPIGIMWLSMALESMLVTNQTFSQNQLKGKLMYLLKDHISIESVNKFVDRFYSLRSKITHGKLKLHRPTLFHDASEEVDKVDNTLSDNGSFGYTAVIYCIQFMILNNMKELNFKEEIIYTLL